MTAGSPSPSRSDARIALPDDQVRAMLWRFADRPELLALVTAARGVARGPVARFVAEGGRRSAATAPARVTAQEAIASLRTLLPPRDPDQAARVSESATLALGLAVFELAWVDGSAAAAAAGLSWSAADTLGLGGSLLGRTGSSEPIDGATAVAVGLMTAAKLLSSVEPVVRHHRAQASEGDRKSPGAAAGVFCEDVRYRLLDIWATGEAAASLGFEAARVLDRAEAMRRAGTVPRTDDERASADRRAMAYLAECAKPADRQDPDRLGLAQRDPLVRHALLQPVADVIGPAVKLWNSGHGAGVLREAVSLMGAEGLAAGCPGFLGYKWVDAQADASAGGGEAAQRRALAATMLHPVFLAQYKLWTDEMRRVASERPGTGACTLASAMQMWLWTLQYLQRARDVDGQPLYQPSRQGVTAPLSDALCWILASRQQILDVMALEAQGRDVPALAGTLPALVPFLMDLCHVQTARAAGEVGRICAELAFGYRSHPSWDREGCSSCYVADELEFVDDVIPGMGATARFYSDVLEADGAHAAKAGPCARVDGLEPFLRMRGKMDGCLTGARLAEDRAAAVLARLPVPERLDYPRDER